MKLYAINNQPLARSCPLAKPLFLLNHGASGKTTLLHWSLNPPPQQISKLFL